ncbi:MAG: uroporphyrinogen-III synthase, partial [Bryobacteraceae bacterium]
DLMPTQYVAESVLDALAGRPVEGRRFLLARAAVARDVLPTELRRRGAIVDVVEAYRTIAPDDLASRARDLFTGTARPHWITFTSSSTVENFVRAAGVEVLRGIQVASIGPVTSATARKLGLEVTVEASEFDAGGLLEAILHKGIIET